VTAIPVGAARRHRRLPCAGSRPGLALSPSTPRRLRLLEHEAGLEPVTAVAPYGCRGSRSGQDPPLLWIGPPRLTSRSMLTTSPLARRNEAVIRDGRPRHLASRDDQTAPVRDPDRPRRSSGAETVPRAFARGALVQADARCVRRRRLPRHPRPSPPGRGPPALRGPIRRLGQQVGDPEHVWPPLPRRRASRRSGPHRPAPRT